MQDCNLNYEKWELEKGLRGNIPFPFSASFSYLWTELMIPISLSKYFTSKNVLVERPYFRREKFEWSAIAALKTTKYLFLYSTEKDFGLGIQTPQAPDFKELIDSE